MRFYQRVGLNGLWTGMMMCAVMAGGWMIDPASARAEDQPALPVTEPVAPVAEAVAAEEPAEDQSAPVAEQSPAADVQADTESAADSDIPAEPEAEIAPEVMAPEPFSPELVIERARILAEKPFENPRRDLPAALGDLNATQYGKIKFRPDQAFFSGSSSGFEMELLHPGYMYDVPVAINLIEKGTIRPVPYSAGFFDFGDSGVSGDTTGMTGYAGLRLRYPLNDINRKQEFAAFLGATYFRVLGRDQQYGQSTRGLVIDIAGPGGEEFPVFREFWIEEPTDQSGTLIVHALLDSARVTGAYQFAITPGTKTVTVVQGKLFFREQVEKIGLAALSSMFLHGEQKRRDFDDYRDEVHNSDGLLIHNGSGEWLWRPLENPQDLQISSFLDQSPRGFGLLQRDRDFDHYQDLDARFEKRPGYWVKPVGDWGKGHVELIEIPSPDETNDNIVAFWVPDNRPDAGSSMEFSYELSAITDGNDRHPFARATDTRITPAPVIDGNVGRRFIVNFAGGELDYYLSDIGNLKANIGALNADVSNVRIIADPKNGGIRVMFDLVARGNATTSDLRAFISYRDRVLSEIWTMPWVF
ncbi:MAG: glucan biosynthesis protein G [Pseudomonadota bacterium]